MGSDDKYVTFKREDFNAWWNQTSVGGTRHDVPAPQEIKDAVVIRRQDYFASPALAGYAASIAIAIRLSDDDKKRAELMPVADYFQRQSELAAEEGWKTPDV
jgi:hypothetical protein